MLLDDELDLAAQYYRLRGRRICNQHILENYARYGTLATVLEQFLSLCSGFLHDLGNGLNAIQGRLESLSLESLDPEQAQAVARAKALCTVCGWRIYTLSEISPSPPMHPEPANLPELIPRLLDAMQAVKPDGVQVNSESVPRLIVADYDNALRLAFVELLLNAFEAMPDGGQVNLSVQKLANGLAQIEIVDTGPGFQASEVSDCFDLRFTTGPRRYGLGLYVARRVVEKHRGTFALQSELGQGTCVVIQLPVGNPEPDWDDENALTLELEKLHDAVAEQEREIEACKTKYALLREEMLEQLACLFGQLGASTVQFVEDGIAGIRQALSFGQEQALLQDPISNQSANHIQFILEKCDYCEALLGNPRALDPDWPIQLAPMDLNQVAANAGRMMAWRAQPGTQLRLKQADSLPLVQADSWLVTTALVNLLRNALDAAGKDGAVDVEFVSVGDDVILRVTNTGNATPSDAQARVFDLDYTTREGRKFGLGLYVVETIIARCDGTIAVAGISGSLTWLQIALPGHVGDVK